MLETPRPPKCLSLDLLVIMVLFAASTPVAVIFYAVFEKLRNGSFKRTRGYEPKERPHD